VEINKNINHLVSLFIVLLLIQTCKLFKQIIDYA
jgi:hypothetical protein